MKNRLKNYWDQLVEWIKSVVNKLGRPTPDDVLPIETSTLDEDRKQVIKKGRQHVIPVNISRTKILIISIAIGVIGIITVNVMYFTQVYRSVSTSSVVYDASRILPTPVGVLNGDRIFYDQVLFQYRTAIKVRDVQPAELPELKQELLGIALDKVFENLAIEQVANEQNVEVDAEEIDTRVAVLEETTGSAEKFEASLRTDYGWNRNDFLREFRIQLLKEKLSPSALTEVSTQLNQGTAFSDVQEGFASDEFPATFSVDDEDSQEDFPVVVTEVARDLTDGNVSNEIPTELGFFFLERSGKTVNVIHVSTEEIDADIAKSIEDSEQFICLNNTGLDYEVEGFLSCAF